jgi:hypothetical protein
VDQKLGGLYALAYTLVQLVAGSVSWLFFTVHRGMHIVGAREGRSAEIRADTLAARAAGTTATLELLDTLAMLPTLMRHIQPNVERGYSAAGWRSVLVLVEADNRDQLPVRRQLSTRTNAWLLASHPAPRTTPSAPR